MGDRSLFSKLEPRIVAESEVEQAGVGGCNPCLVAIESLPKRGLEHEQCDLNRDGLVNCMSSQSRIAIIPLTSAFAPGSVSAQPSYYHLFQYCSACQEVVQPRCLSTSGTLRLLFDPCFKCHGADGNRRWWYSSGA